MQTMQAPLDWLSLNWHLLVGWLMLAGFMWKIINFLGSAKAGALTFVTRAEEAETTVKLLATNHIPHLQEELEKSNEKADLIHETLIGLRADVQAMTGFRRK